MYVLCIMGIELPVTKQGATWNFLLRQQHEAGCAPAQ